MLRPTQGASPLCFKLCKLQLKILNKLNGNRHFRPKNHIYRKKICARMRWFMQATFRNTAMEILFFAFTGHMAYIKG